MSELRQELQLPSPIYDEWRRVPDSRISEWITPDHLASCTSFTTEGFEVIEHIDGKQNPEVEVSFVRIKGENEYPQHRHRKSDAFFVITSGHATLLSGSKRVPVSPGDRVEVPRGMLHGFELEPGTILEFVSFQNPPIKDHHTGEIDLEVLRDRV